MTIAVTIDQLRRAAIGVACFFAAIGPTRAADMPARPNSLPGCDSATYEQAIKTGHTIAAVPMTAVFTDYVGAEADKLLDAINAFPFPSQYQGEHILVIEWFDEDIPVRVGIVHDGCVVMSARILKEYWSELRRSAIGDAL